MGKSQDKGKFLEDIVSRVHKVTGIHAEPRVRVPCLRDAKRFRTIDVLLHFEVGPYPGRIAIECKSWGKPVTVNEVGAFIDMLGDVGINVRGSIYVSATGYQTGAAARAREVGIRPLEIEGLTPDRIAEEVRAAVTGSLFLFPRVSEVTYQSGHPVGSPMFFNEDGLFGGTIFDLAWKHWMGTADLMLGTSSTSEPMPKGWGSYHEGDFCQIQKVDISLSVEGHLLRRAGTLKGVTLKEEGSGAPVLGDVHAEFDSVGGTIELSRFTTEEELQREMKADETSLVILSRIKVPRILYDGPHGTFAWLPDDELFGQIAQIYAHDPDSFGNPSSGSRIQMATDIAMFFRPPSASYVEGLRERLGSTWDRSLFVGS